MYRTTSPFHQVSCSPIPNLMPAWRFDMTNICSWSQSHAMDNYFVSIPWSSYENAHLHHQQPEALL